MEVSGPKLTSGWLCASRCARNLTLGKLNSVGGWYLVVSRSPLPKPTILLTHSVTVH